MRLVNLKKFNNSFLLRITLFSGLILLLITCAFMTFFYIGERSSTKTQRQQNNFIRALYEYDLQLTGITGTDRDYERLNRELDRLERMTIGVESWLSVLKRRRALSNVYPPSVESYRRSIANALEAYPVSQPIAAIAAEALVKNTAINREDEQTLRDRLSLITDPSFNNLRLGLHVLLGDFRNPERASVLPDSLFSDGTEAITINLLILKIIRGDTRTAASEIQTMLYSPSPSSDVLRFAGEFYYDFGELSRSAEIFSMIDDDKARIREADALYLAGFQDSARALWSILADSLNERSIYNLGVTSYNREEAAGHFERLIQLNTPAVSDYRQFGVIRYSRLLDYPQALALLEGTEGLSPVSNPFIDLEICRRQAPWWELGRQLAETWLLLDRHPENKYLYDWAAWMFLFQRNYSEIKILLNRMDNLQYTDDWANVYRAISLIFEGELETAEEILKSIPVQNAAWTVHANLGRIFEAYRSIPPALEQYELAAVKTSNPKIEARILTRMARCFSALNRPSDALRALLIAVELDPDNLNARLELDRLSY